MNLPSHYQTHHHLPPHHHQPLQHHSSVIQNHHLTPTTTYIPLQQPQQSLPIIAPQHDMNKFKLRFIPSDDYTKNTLNAYGKKLFLDLTLKKTKTWRSVMDYLCTKWGDIPNLLLRLHLYYVDQTGVNIISNLSVDLNMMVIESLVHHPSMTQPPSIDQGSIFPLFYLLQPEETIVQMPEMVSHFEPQEVEAHHETSANSTKFQCTNHIMIDNNHEIHYEESGVRVQQEDKSPEFKLNEDSVFNVLRSIGGNHSLLEPFNKKNDEQLSHVENFSQFPDHNRSLFGSVGEQSILNILGNGSLVDGIHTIGGHDFTRFLKNLDSVKEDAIIDCSSQENKSQHEEIRKELSPAGTIKHSFSHIFVGDEPSRKLEASEDSNSTRNESSPSSVTESSKFEELSVEPDDEKNSKKRILEDTPVDDPNAAIKASVPEQPKKKKKASSKPKKLLPLRGFISIPASMPMMTVLSDDKSFIAKLSRVGRSRPELRRINPTFVRPL